MLSGLDLTDVTLVGFSMGGGEVARYISRHGEDGLHSAVFAAAVPPYLLQGDDNPDGPLTQEAAAEMTKGLESDRTAFFDALAHQSDQTAPLGCMTAFATTDFRDDLAHITVPTLVIHGDSDATVPFEGSGKRTHEAIAGSELVVVADAPHGLNVSHAEEFNRALLAFLER